MKSIEEYKKEISGYCYHWKACENLWKIAEKEHHFLNKKLIKIFDKLEKNKKINLKQLDEYLQIRSRNDHVNSQMKIFSTSTNAMWILIQDTYRDMLINHNKKIFVNFEKIDRVNGRLIFSIKEKGK